MKEYVFTNPDDDNDEISITEEKIIDIAVYKHHRDGRIEVDPWRNVPIGTDGTHRLHDDEGDEMMPHSRISESEHGTYVMAWVWVDFHDMKED